MKILEPLSGSECVVIVPVYKACLSAEERASFIQCLKVLHSFDIVLAGPENIKKETYLDLSKQASKEIRFTLFPNYYFKSISGYNNLLLSRMFYSHFNKYEYLLIYQLDAWVFRDDLSIWCQKGWDYIGAPSFDHLDVFEPEGTWIGNGGLSLRKTKAFLLEFKGFVWYETYVRVSLLHKESLIKRLIETLLLLIQAFVLKHGGMLVFRRIKYEDLFWTHIGNLRIPDFQLALEFSFEKFPSQLFERNQNKLPFGCHAWSTFEYESFWKNYISLNTDNA